MDGSLARSSLLCAATEPTHYPAFASSLRHDGGQGNAACIVATKAKRAAEQYGQMLIDGFTKVNVFEVLYAASEKAEIIRLVEQSHLPVRRTLEQLGIPRAAFYRWYDLYQTGGPEALGDRSSRPGRV
jgi:hypothetical protein